MRISFRVFVVDFWIWQKKLESSYVKIQWHDDTIEPRKLKFKNWSNARRVQNTCINHNSSKSKKNSFFWLIYSGPESNQAPFEVTYGYEWYKILKISEKGSF